MTEEATEDQPKSTSSIVDSKYAGRYRNASDFIGDLINDQCLDEYTETTASGKERVTRRLNVHKVLDLAEKNGGDVTVLRNQTDRPNAPGRIRMSAGNMLRARAIRRHGLYNLKGEAVRAPLEFLQEHEAPDRPTETMDGKKIKAEEVASDEVQAA